MPKSISFGTPSAVTSTLAGLISLCTTSMRCAAATAPASCTSSRRCRSSSKFLARAVVIDAQAVDELHGNPGAAVLHAGIHQAAPRRGVRSAPTTAPLVRSGLGRHGHRGGNEFDGHRLLYAVGALGAVHDPHAAFADPRRQAKVSVGLPGQFLGITLRARPIACRWQRYRGSRSATKHRLRRETRQSAPHSRARNCSRNVSLVVQRLGKQLVSARPIAAAGHCLRVSSRASHALPVTQRRLTVATDSFNTSAASSIDNPPNTRSETMSAATASNCCSSDSRVSTSSAS